MSEKFAVHRAHKMLDWIENEVTEWATGLIQEHFGVECPSELSQSQIEEVIAAWEDLVDYDGMLGLGFRNAINVWENEHEEYLI